MQKHTHVNKTNILDINSNIMIQIDTGTSIVEFVNLKDKILDIESQRHVTKPVDLLLRYLFIKYQIL